MSRYYSQPGDGGPSGGTGGGTEVIVDGVPLDEVRFSSILPTAAEIGAAPASLVLTVDRKADLVDGKVPLSQIPAGIGGGGGATSKFHVIMGSLLVTPNVPVAVNYDSGTILTGGTGFTYAAPPHISFNLQSTAGSGTVVRATATATTTTGFQLNLIRSNDTATGVDWIAFGMIP